MPLQLVFADSTDWIQPTLDLAINNHFKEAESLLNHRIATEDSSAETWFYLASVLNSKMNYYENSIDPQPFTKVVNTLIRKAEALLEQNGLTSEQRANGLFYRGSAYGYLAFYQSRSGSYFAALRNGLHSIGDLKKCIGIDSVFYDAYLGIGAYQYWRSSKFKFLFWSPFVEDLRPEGIKNIRKAIVNSKYSRYLAMHQMIYILTNYGKMDEALNYARQAVQAYPNSIFMYWAFAHTLYKRHEYSKAIEAFKYLSHLMKKTSEKNPAHLTECYSKMAEIYFKTNQAILCRQMAEQALEQAAGKDLSPEGQESVKQARQYLDRLAR